jgi:LuxR family maltose regulon positive regulatory protein
MSAPIVVTKLFVPRPQPKAVRRPRLLDRLNDGLHALLTLLSAPAGFGKTTLIAEWVAGGRHPTAWLSLDEGDNDPGRFLHHLIAALRTVAGSVGERVLGALQSAQPPPAEWVLTSLVNELSNFPDRFVLVLDDYHVIDAKPVEAALVFLLEHLPPSMHLVIATREDPQLPLARLRVRGQLNELRAADLRFTASEAAEFLNSVMGLSISAEGIAVLESRTEGWIAGLQLAALSMQGQHNVAGFIQTFAGNHRYIADYLVDEVLGRQPEDVRSFLLQTSILEQLTGPLCNAVTGQEGGGARLEALERGNFFVVPLDERRQWYRYHHLFAQVLHAHLLEEQADRVSALHRNASAWYERHGAVADAIRHALSGQDFARAADLVERAVPMMRRSRQEAALLRWLRALPDELLRRRPALSVWYAHVLLATGELEGVEARLVDAERWLGAAPGTSEGVVVDDEESRRLPGAIAVARAGQALARGDVAQTVLHAQRALELVPEDDPLSRGAAAAFVGLTHWTRGALEQAHQMFADGMASVQRAGHLVDAVSGAIKLADIRIGQGLLREAKRIYERGLELATGQGGPVLRGAADMHVGLSELHRERNELAAATQHVLRSRELGEHTGFPQYPYRWRVAMARIRHAEGDLDAAVQLLDEAERLYAGDFSPNVRPVAAIRTRVWLAQGRVQGALDWARERKLSAQDAPSYLSEYEHITLARVLMAGPKGDPRASLLDAMGLLERLLHAAEEGERMGSEIEIRVLQALAKQALGDLSGAGAVFRPALALAEPEGYVRVFLDEGAALAPLLREAIARERVPAFARSLLAALGPEQPSSAGAAAVPTARPALSLVEPLSDRELDVLRLFDTELSGPEIANELAVALSTVRTHTKSIFSKLGVNSRRAAVKRAAELGLL